MNGRLIPLYDETGRLTSYKDKVTGRIIRTAAEMEELTKVAGGPITLAQPIQHPMQAIREKIQVLRQRKQAAPTQAGLLMPVIPKSEFSWGLLLLSLAVAFLFRPQRRRRN